LEKKLSWCSRRSVSRRWTNPLMKRENLSRRMNY